MASYRELDGTILRSVSAAAWRYLQWMKKYYWRPKNRQDCVGHKRWRENHTAYTSAYAAGVFGVTPRTITRWNTELTKAGLIVGVVTGRAKQFRAVENSVETRHNEHSASEKMSPRIKEESDVLKGFTSSSRNTSRCGNVEKERGNPGRGSQTSTHMPSPAAPATQTPSQEAKPLAQPAPATLREEIRRNKTMGIEAFLARAGVHFHKTGNFERLLRREGDADSSKSVSPPSET